MAKAAKAANVAIVTGDTKVVERGKGDGIFITTSGVGVVPEGIHISGDRARLGDYVILSGTIGDHGIALLSQREHLAFLDALGVVAREKQELLDGIVTLDGTARF